MARKINIKKRSDWIYFDDVPNKDKKSEDDPDTVCEAIRVPDDPSEEVAGASQLQLRSVPLNVALTASNELAQGQAGEGLFRLVKGAVTACKNFRDEDGNEVELGEDFYDLIPFEEANAIAMYVMNEMMKTRRTKKERQAGN